MLKAMQANVDVALAKALKQAQWQQPDGSKSAGIRLGDQQLSTRTGIVYASTGSPFRHR